MLNTNILVPLFLIEKYLKIPGGGGGQHLHFSSKYMGGFFLKRERNKK